MKTSSRALLGFGVGIVVLVMITVGLVLTLGKGNPPLLDENTPQGIVQRYMNAIQEKNYQAAYNFLAPVDPNDPNYPKGPPIYSFDNWVMSAQNAGNITWRANLGKVSTSGDNANVETIIDTFRPNGPFGNPVNSHNVTFFLKKVGSNWLITSPMDLYWLY
jgi:hypothetical protein